MEMIFLSTEGNRIFAQRFKQLRIKGGYTQQQMANLFNVTRPCICYWENGKRVPDFFKLVEICRFFGVASDYLLGVTDTPKPIFKEDNVDYRADNYIDLTTLTEESRADIRKYYELLLFKQNNMAK